MRDIHHTILYAISTLDETPCSAFGQKSRSGHVSNVQPSCESCISDFILLSHLPQTNQTRPGVSPLPLLHIVTYSSTYLYILKWPQPISTTVHPALAPCSSQAGGLAPATSPGCVPREGRGRYAMPATRRQRLNDSEDLT